ncbi:MAG: methyl-accepting chemotaxis protein [Candidatus Eremiobacterota bacterium]
MSIKLHLLITCVLLVAIPVLIISFLGYSSVKKEIINQVEDNICNEARLISENVKNRYFSLQAKTDSDLSVARNIFYAAGKPALNKREKETFNAVNQISKKVNSVSIYPMEINGEKIPRNYNIVDNVQNIVGCTCTIFQVIPDGLLRVSTNVKTKEGERAVGTYIPSDSPVYQTVMKGDTYRGRAFVVTEWYMTAYEPIKDDAGTIIGALYVGIKEKPYQDQLLNGLARITIGKTGYIFILDASEDDPKTGNRGKYVLSKDREADGEQTWDMKDARGNYLGRELIETGEKLGDGEVKLKTYLWLKKGENTPNVKIASLVFVPQLRWVIGPSVNYDEVLEGLYRIRTMTILLAIIFILLGAIVAYVFASFISTPFEKMVHIFKKVAAGDLSEAMDIKTSISELENLRDSCNKMIVSVKNTISVMNKLIDSLTTSSRELTEVAQGMGGGPTAEKVKSGSETMSKMSQRLETLVKEYKL